MTTQIFLIFVPVFEKPLDEKDKITTHFKIYLSNETALKTTFQITQTEGFKITFSLNGDIEPKQCFFTHTLGFDSFQLKPKFTVTLFDYQSKQKITSLEKKIASKDLIKSVTSSSHFSFSLGYIHQTKEKESFVKLFFKKNLSSQFIENHTLPKPSKTKNVLDLHAEKLGLNLAKMSPSEIFNYQLKIFEKEYANAVRNNLPIFTVVHGIGEGVLKKKIHEYLKDRKEIKDFFNQQHRDYGFGCTEIHFAR